MKKYDTHYASWNTDDYVAYYLNIQHSIKIEDRLEIQQEEFGLQVCSALYHLKYGKVEFLELCEKE